MDNLIDEKDVIYEPEDTISTFDAGNDVLTLLKDATILGLDEEGNEIPGYVFAESISEILGMPIETLVDFARQNGYTIFTAHVNGEELPANLYVICAKGCDIQTIKDDYKEIYELDIELRPTEEPKEQERVELAIDEAKGLYANIHAKRKRIKAGSGERMRKPGSKGAPTKKDFKDASKTVKEERISKGMSVEDIAEKHGVSIRAIEMQIEKGIKVEKEHTDNETEARRIAMDHLVEIADYYTRLNKMEKDANKNLKEAEDKQKELRLFGSLFKNPEKLDAIRDVSNPGHWAHGGRYFVFSYKGKFYHYEDYNSSAYIPGESVHQLRLFRQIDKEEDNIIKDINPEDVGLIIKKNFYGNVFIIGGKIDLDKLDSLSESFIKETKQNELEKRAKQHKKKDKKGARGWFVNPNAGNVEHNIKFFNKALGNKETEPTTTADGSVGGMLSTNTQGTSGAPAGATAGGGMGESLDFVKNENETKEEFVSRFITERKEQYESVRKCYEDALSHWEKNQ